MVSCDVSSKFASLVAAVLLRRAPSRCYIHIKDWPTSYWASLAALFLAFHGVVIDGCAAAGLVVGVPTGAVEKAA